MAVLPPRSAPLLHATLALVGRHAFSAAGDFTTVLERDTEAILAGEPTGGAPNQDGDARAVALDRGRLLRGPRPGPAGRAGARGAQNRAAELP